MDDRLNELMSRHLDDDLSDAERADFDRMLEADSRLRSEVDRARSIRRAVATLAATMEPPAELDRVMEPLRQGPPAPRHRVRPVFRWLGAAAAVVFGVTVTLEMARRNPSPTMAKPTRTVAANGDDREIFELAPLPSAVSDEDRPVGATARLLEEEPPQPSAPEPSALEVVGPLTTDEIAVTADSQPAARSDKKGLRAVETDTPSHGSSAPEEALRQAVPSGRNTGGGLGAAEAHGIRGDHGSSVGDPASAGIEDAARPDKNSLDFDQPVADHLMIVLVDGIAVWTGTTNSCDAGRWPVVLDLRDGVVADLKAITRTEGGGKTGICRPVELIDEAISGLQNGRVTAEIVVQPPQ